MKQTKHFDKNKQKYENVKLYITDSVISEDGTTIGYRQFGQGPGIIAMHGGGQSSQNFMKLAEELSDDFTVYVPDRRGRGLSGSFGDNYSIKKECEDIDALLHKTGAHNVFGLSSGALISLQATLILPAIYKVALYEPPLSINHSTPTNWLTRFDREIAQGKLGSAVVTALKGTQTAPPILRFIPRFLLASLLNFAARHGSEDKDVNRDRGPIKSPISLVVLHFLLWPLRKIATKNSPQGNKVTKHEDIPLKALVPTMHYDAHLVIETEGTLANFKGVLAKVLLLGGNKSPAYLKVALNALEKTLPNVGRVEFTGVGHLAADNNGKPTLVAQALRQFFGNPN